MSIYAPKEFQEKVKREYKEIRKSLIAKMGGYCWHCGTKKALSCHHLIPVRYSGTNDIENLILVCLIDKERTVIGDITHFLINGLKNIENYLKGKKEENYERKNARISF